ncbi:aldehyde dehydrogenase [Mycolicibacterium phlei]|uniref:aldehyde dehydrogenase n=1 Tax=Mycolicibacterium phlei TaxID=1771 RepID=UPI00178C64AB|nr:aldehyde dehydrogenase [Mycolicibacterium phlei]
MTLLPESAAMIAPALSAAYVAGTWTPGTGPTVAVLSPASGEQVGTVHTAGPAEVDAAVAAARSALHSPWRDTTPAERGAMLARLADALAARKGELADLATAEIGSPRSWSTFGQVLTAVGVLRAYAGITPTYAFESTRPSAAGTAIIRQVPVGVVGAVIPWNTPLFIAALKLGPALAAGCTVVLKPAPDAPLSIGVLVEAMEEAGLPAGVVNIVNGGAETGEYLVSHPDVDKVTFTGSTAVGARIASLCGAQLRRCSTELGGKSAAIVLPDAPLESTVKGLVAGVMGNNGQLCAALTRILLPRSRYDEFATALTTAVGALKVGDPADRSTDIGPLVNEAARDKVERLLARARQDGAQILVGGERLAGPGWFITPAVVAATNDMEIAREEVFGPVAVIIEYDDSAGDSAAVEIANDSRYGLVGAVWSADAERAAAVGSQLQAGSVAINSTAVLDFGSPFGGFKQSGIGREGGPEGIAGFVEYQVIIK